MRSLFRNILAVSASLTTIAAFAANPATPAVVAKADLPAPRVDPGFVSFVEKYCSECHNDFNTEGDRSFDAFLTTPDDQAHEMMLGEMLDALNHGTMPKKKPGKDVLMPSDDERRAATAAATSYLVALASLRDPVETPLRRLTNNEYRSTVRDLLGVQYESSPTAMSLSPDNLVHGLPNVAVGQTISLQTMQSYVMAAQEYMDAAFEPVLNPPPAAKTLKLPMSGFVSGTPSQKNKFTNLNRQVWTNFARDGSYFDFGSSQVDGTRAYFPKPILDAGGVPADGVYTIRVEAEALHRQNDYKAGVRTTIDDPLKLAIGYAPNPRMIEVVDAPGRPVLGVYDIPDNKRRTIEIRTPLRKGSVPMMYWVNGLNGGTAPIHSVIEKHYPELQQYLGERSTFVYEKGGKSPQPLLDFLETEYRGPRVRIHSVTVEGPYPVEVPGAFTTADFSRFARAPKSSLPKVFAEFATRAFRRPVSEKEMAPFLAFTRKALDDGASQIDALKIGFSAVLSSPQFLYLDEGDSQDGLALTDYQLASRLSYFLWGTMPDKQLLDLAAAKKLSDDKVLEAQVMRMIGDDRSSAFVTGFTRAWLRLDKLGNMPPDNRVHAIFFEKRLEPAMRRETELVFSDILHGNRNPDLFLDSDFTYVNGGLAKLYDLPGIQGEDFQKVSLAADSPRRGLIGHASILTASANGIDTSPVVRGVWVLENLVGTPPPPPPPDIPAIEPDARGATTIRQLLDKHRSVQTCADCHANIDPYGFPLEAFGPIGEARTRYAKQIDGRARLNQGLPVETDTVLPNGTEIKTLVQFRNHLKQRSGDFRRHLVEKLLTYGSGREPTIRDRAEIDRILDELKTEQGGFRDMLVKVAMSDYFTSR